MTVDGIPYVTFRILRSVNKLTACQVSRNGVASTSGTSDPLSSKDSCHVRSVIVNATVSLAKRFP
jgi:hypothetical protein